MYGSGYCLLAWVTHFSPIWPLIFQDRLDQLPRMLDSGQHSKREEVNYLEQVTPAQLQEGGETDSLPGWEGAELQCQGSWILEWKKFTAIKQHTPAMPQMDCKSQK